MPDEPAEERPASGGDWAAFNEKQRCKVQDFAKRLQPARLVIANELTRSMLELFSHALSISSDSWLVDRFVENMQADRDETVLTRIVAAHRGAHLDQFFQDVECLLNEQRHAWKALLLPHELTAGNASLAFCLHSRASAGLVQLLRERCKGFPFKLFTLIEGAAEAHGIANTPRCLLDDFSTAVIDKFRGQLTGATCRATLLTVALLADIDIASVECRHAAIRRSLQKHQTWIASAADVSADFVLCRARVQERGSRPEEKGTQKQGKKQNPQQRGGGGGAYRAFLSDFITGQGVSGQEALNQALRDAARAYKNLSEEEMAQYRHSGALGTRAHRAGGTSFGRQRRRRSASAPLPAAIVGQEERALEGTSDLAPLQLMISQDDHRQMIATAKHTRAQQGAQAARDHQNRLEALAGWSTEHQGSRLFPQVPAASLVDAIRDSLPGRLHVIGQSFHFGVLVMMHPNLSILEVS